MRKITLYLFIAAMMATSCKLSIDKKIGKVERKIAKTQRQIEKKRTKIAGYEQQLVILKEKQEELLASGDNEVDKKKIEKIEKTKAQIAELQSELENLEVDKGQSAVSKKDKSATFIEIEKRQFKKYLDIQGTVTAKENIIVSAESGGVIQSIPVVEGKEVSKGQTLARIDASLIYSNIKEVENALELATTVYEKQKRLWDQKIGSELQLLEAKNNKENLERKLATLQTQVSKTIVKAPFAGTVDQVFANVGETAGPGTPIARVVNLSNVRIEAEISEAYIGQFEKGDEVIISFPSIDKTRKGEISAVGQFINPGNRTYLLEISLSNQDGLLKPNLLANIQLLEYSSSEALVVPSKLVQQGPEGDFVYTVSSENIVQKNIVEMGQSYDGKTEILKGLEAGDVLIDKGHKDVIAGDRVKSNS